MQRYFLNLEATLNTQYIVSAKYDVHHIKTVMRLTIGDKIIINFLNATYICEIRDVSQEIEVTTIEQVELFTELPVNVTIASGLLKNDKYEWMLQKATELGAHSFLPFISDHTIIKIDDKKMVKKVERYQKIIKEAAEQSYRQIIPEISVVKNSKVLSELISQFDFVLIAYEESAKNGETSTLHQVISEIQQGASLLVIFGPEGGLSPEEITLFNAPSIGLGPRILRAETAPLYLLSAISYQLELS
ncbi:16S rRNA (uracil(1498)-N(3))-methyltransferase [Macrococcus animalis]|uniref:16S rRNA (uracil(1498)-N(3))-methyltransferase n=1 Tax=Macrococcus animalis TaxID=3395467 RepID=UPI0039BE58E4